MSGITQYARFIERNEWEGETWSFWIPLDGNKEALLMLAQIIALSEEWDEKYEVHSDPVPESDVDVLVKYVDDTGYMAARNKLSGKLVLPDDLSAMLADEDGKDPFYKGGIRNLMHKQQRQASAE